MLPAAAQCIMKRINFQRGYCLKHKWMSPGRFIALGFGGLILLGMLLLMLPVSARPGVKIGPLEALFTSTSAVCVTGLLVVDTADSFSVFGRTVIAILIQIGGLGVASIGISFFLLAGKSVGIRERVWVRESLNLDTLEGIVRLVKSVLLITFAFELLGTALSYVEFSRHYEPLSALGISAFHSIASFNNAGFDILGSFRSLGDYRGNVLLNLTTAGLVIFGGLGFYALREIAIKRSFGGFSLNTKIVLMMTGVLLAAGTLLVKLTDSVSWLEAFFISASARTAGFATKSIDTFSSAGQFVIILLMFIGASPGSTGGGTKTTTAFTLYRSILSFATNKPATVFHRQIPRESVLRAFMVSLMGLALICLMTFLINIIDPQFSFLQILFEVVSGFGTVGLSTGITPGLSSISKLLLCVTMFTGRLGPLTMACIWVYKPAAHVSYGEEPVTIG